VQTLTRRAPEPLRLLLDKKQAAVAICASERFLDGMIQRGEIVPIKMPGRGGAPRAVRFLVSDLQAYVDKIKGEQTADQQESPETR
jgi:hypothetical protein